MSDIGDPSRGAPDEEFARENRQGKIPDLPSLKRHKFGHQQHADVPDSTDGLEAAQLNRGGRTAFVGRGVQLHDMREVAEESERTRSARRITVVGNQGTGKSRLVQELLDSLPTTTLIYRCQAVRNGARYSTVAGLLKARFAISEHAPLDEAMDEFRHEVEDVLGESEIGEVLHVLGKFLDLDFPASPFLKVLGASPKQYEEVARTVLRRFIEMDGRRGAVVLFVDDLHWADKSSLSLLLEVAHSLKGAPVTLIASARPDLELRAPGWGGGASTHLKIYLSNFEAKLGGEMFRSLLTRCESIPEEMVEDAVEMTGGNPGFLSQIVRLFLANGAIDVSRVPWEVDSQIAFQTDLPITVEEAIEGRIAGLGLAEREVLEKGAAFGNVFWLGAVVAVSRIERHIFQERLGGSSLAVAGDLGLAKRDWEEAEEVRQNVIACVATLVERDYLLQLDDENSMVPGEVELVFRHNLERELITRSTERGRLARYHRLAAQWIETKSPARTEEELEFLGQLYERGGDGRRAAHRFISGGDRARDRYANERAISLYRRGLALLEEDDAVVLLDALHNLGSVLDLVGETAEAQELFLRMLRNAWLFGHQAKGGAAHNRLGRVQRRLGEYEQAMLHLEKARILFAECSDLRGVAGTLDDIGQVHWLRGDYNEALDFHRQALEIRREIGDPRSIAVSLANIGRVHRQTGAFMAASKQFYEALSLRRGIADRAGVIQSLCDLAEVHSADGTWTEALEMFEEARRSALSIGDKLALVHVLAGLGRCQASMGHFSGSIESLLEGQAIARGLGDLSGAVVCYLRLAQTYLSVRNGAQALDNARRALELGKRIGSQSHIGCAHRVMGDAIFLLGSTPAQLRESGEHFQLAVEILAEIHNELELAITYRSYAAHREHMGRLDEAEQLRCRAEEIYKNMHGAIGSKSGRSQGRRDEA